MVSHLTPVDDVIDYLKSRARCLVGTETIQITSALDRVLAVDVVSTLDVPMLDNSAMDGYAINTAELSAGAILAVSDRIPAGSTGQALRAGTAARIFTGAPVPAGLRS